MEIKKIHSITRHQALSILYNKLKELDSEALEEILEDFPEAVNKKYKIINKPYEKTIRKITRIS